MTEVIKLHPQNDPDIVLQNAVGQFDSVLIIGFLSDNGEIDCRGTIGYKGEIMYLIEQFKHKLLAGDYDE